MLKGSALYTPVVTRPLPRGGRTWCAPAWSGRQDEAGDQAEIRDKPLQVRFHREPIPPARAALPEHGAKGSSNGPPTTTNLYGRGWVRGTPPSTPPAGGRGVGRRRQRDVRDAEGGMAQKSAASHHAARGLASCAPRYALRAFMERHSSCLQTSSRDAETPSAQGGRAPESSWSVSADADFCAHAAAKTRCKAGFVALTPSPASARMGGQPTHARQFGHGRRPGAARPPSSLLLRRGARARHQLRETYVDQGPWSSADRTSRSGRRHLSARAASR